ncbi:hypothetical protein Ahy_A08g039296 isoform B [Arachis hypogaea]|uniref:MSP domain-containing protein n=1 Tax=Arachis hypogaea TaxID=3818 RepID=A0A445BWC5_ARAHY|nr:hypothetical protein Ahy_A08g039296 isoform B [Arachis hypogaea]
MKESASERTESLIEDLPLKVSSVQPIDSVELEKQSFCDLKVVNNKENYVAFKVKTTSPKKYFVRPNTGVIQPWDSCIIRGAELSNGKVAETKFARVHKQNEDLKNLKN